MNIFDSLRKRVKETPDTDSDYFLKLFGHHAINEDIYEKYLRIKMFEVGEEEFVKITKDILADVISDDIENTECAIKYATVFGVYCFKTSLILAFELDYFDKVFSVLKKMSKYPFYYFIGEDDLRVIPSQDVGEFYEDLMFVKHLSFVDFEDLFGLAISKTNVDSKNKELILRSIHQENKSAFENIILDNGLSVAVASKYVCLCAMCFFLAQGDISNVGFNKMLSVLKDKLSFVKSKYLEQFEQTKVSIDAIAVASTALDGILTPFKSLLVQIKNTDELRKFAGDIDLGILDYLKYIPDKEDNDDLETILAYRLYKYRNRPGKDNDYFDFEKQKQMLSEALNNVQF